MGKSDAAQVTKGWWPTGCIPVCDRMTIPLPALLHGELGCLVQQQQSRWVATNQPIAGSAPAACCREAAHPSAGLHLSTKCWHWVQVRCRCLGRSHIRGCGILQLASLCRHRCLPPAAGRGREAGEERRGQPGPLSKHPSQCGASAEPSAGSCSWPAAVFQVPRLALCQRMLDDLGHPFGRRCTCPHTQSVM